MTEGAESSGREEQVPEAVAVGSGGGWPQRLGELRTGDQISEDRSASQRRRVKLAPIGQTSEEWVGRRTSCRLSAVRPQQIRAPERV